ncbi:50S ribosomal protein L29 [Candidatus Parcubacteria bacterium]|nr:50S ribosomal protein L29 [Candidatus Parcubacteria bacterium]
MSKDIKTMKAEDLQKSLNESRKKLQEFRFAVSGASTKNSKEARDLKRSIAQILTEQKARQKS